MIAGNQRARKYPRVERDDGAVQQTIADNREHIIRNKGGRDALSWLQLRAIDVLTADVDPQLHAWRDYWNAHAPYTRQGRMRSGYPAWLQTVDRFMRLAQLIGMDVEQKPVGGIDALIRRVQQQRDADAATSTDTATDDDTPEDAA